MQNPSGHIQVKAWDKHEVMVVGQHASGNVEVDTEQVGNRIEVATRTSGTNVDGRGDLHTDYEITVPTETELQVRTDSGNVTVDSVHGDMSFDTVAADLALQDVEGYLVIKSIGGSLVCTRCAGRLDATSISGNFQLVQPVMDNVRVQTSSGNILFDGSFLSRGIYVLKNYSGTIEVRFSSNDSFDVQRRLALRQRHQPGARRSRPPPHARPAYAQQHGQEPVRLDERRTRQGRTLLLQWYNQNPEARIESLAPPFARLLLQSDAFRRAPPSDARGVPRRFHGLRQDHGGATAGSPTRLAL